RRCIRAARGNTTTSAQPTEAGARHGYRGREARTEIGSACRRGVSETGVFRRTTSPVPTHSADLAATDRLACRNPASDGRPARGADIGTALVSAGTWFPNPEV